MRFQIRERALVTGVTAGATGYLLLKRGLGAKFAVGGITPGLAMLLVGLALTGVDGDGAGGAIVDGVAFGLIVSGAFTVGA